MLKRYPLVRKVAREISAAADGAFEAYTEHRVEEEPQITDRILGAIEGRISGQIFNDVIWRARTLRTGRGIAAEEKRHGADLMGVLDIHLPDYETKKGFLAQAKRAEPNSRFPQREWERLTEQCKNMLARTPASFVLVYSRSCGIRIFPAVSVLGSRSKDIFDLYHHGVQRFFEDHLQCFIGDSRLNAPNIEVLDALVDFPVNNVLHLRAEPPE